MSAQELSAAADPSGRTMPGSPVARGGRSSTVAPEVLDLVANATAFLRAHHREALTVQDLAEYLSYSPSHLTRTFTALVGSSPIGYLSAWRLHEAKQLLVHPGVGVAEACHEVGYTSVGTFTRRFTRDVGLAPGALSSAAARSSSTTAGSFMLSPDIVRPSPLAGIVSVTARPAADGRHEAPATPPPRDTHTAPCLNPR
ncbi:MAG: helix-turn-helix transcriptional regulator [Actinomyces sp.]|uniref:helix-turn-helix transcriptional regulator n=1 Tax=Actinomyces sp. TaxID=29317 RepID=UPI0026DAA4DD|nr:helix-turn-helix transcriptional regulator [Actinomyces sp.]MDO4244103.1 helix-turn-helix transcriptional regulator [Actinomyces sp.]